MDSTSPEPDETAETEHESDSGAADGPIRESARGESSRPASTPPTGRRTTRSRSRRPPEAETATPEAETATESETAEAAAARPKRRRSTRPSEADEAALAVTVPPTPPLPRVEAHAPPEKVAPTDAGAQAVAALRPAGPVEGHEPARERPRDSRTEEGRDARRDERDERRDDKGPRPAIHRRAFPSEHLDDDALKVLRRLHRHGYKAYLVGGGVRDLLLGRKPKDFDVATSARPHEVQHLFRNCRIIGRRFRLAHILFQGGKVIETATFRRDPTTAADEDTFLADAEAAYATSLPEGQGEPRWREAIDSGEFDAASFLRSKPRDDDADLLIRNDNVFGEPHEDALRRDFTINGLFYDIERGEVIDYVGGLRDLERRAIDTIGLPDVRFREDPIRILRAIKFSARLDLGIDPDCYDAMVAQREELRKAAKPRLLEEILRLLRGGAAHRSIWLAWEIGVLSVVLPELAVFLDDDAPRSRLLWGRLDAIDASVRRGQVPSDSVLLAALLLGPVEEALEGTRDPASAYEDFMHEVNESLAVPRRLKERMRAIIGSQRRLRAGRLGSLHRRDFFAEAVQLLELECAARGVRAPDIHAELAEGAPDGEVLVRRRRRRRPRR